MFLYVISGGMYGFAALEGDFDEGYFEWSIEANRGTNLYFPFDSRLMN